MCIYIIHIFILIWSFFGTYYTSAQRAVYKRRVFSGGKGELLIKSPVGSSTWLFWVGLLVLELHGFWMEKMVAVHKYQPI